MSAASWLFVPGDSARKIERALQGAAHALIFDWEDAVAPQAKATARTVTRDALSAVRVPRERLWIRINALTTSYHADDIEALPVCAIAGVVLPKACGVDDVRRVSASLDAIDPQASLKICGIVTETAASVLALSEFRVPMPRLHAMMWGGEDLSADLGIADNRAKDGAYRAPFLLARNLMLMAAAATQCVPIDTVFVNFKDHDALAAEAVEARADGFTAKAAIHPDQVAVINDVFSSTPEELEWARAVIDAMEHAQGGVASMNGKMLDAPHLRLAKRMLGR